MKRGIIMTGKTVNLTPGMEYAIKKIGIRLKKARLRRNIMAEVLAEEVGISKGTLAAIEKGVPTVSIGAYVAVLCGLDMERDLELVALDRVGRENYRENNFQERKRATRSEEEHN
jgi:transcriptional regulator with XRE-family HTH domain